jgi:hypothetical protein
MNYAGENSSKVKVFERITFPVYQEVHGILVNRTHETLRRINHYAPSALLPLSDRFNSMETGTSMKQQKQDRKEAMKALLRDRFNAGDEKVFRFDTITSMEAQRIIQLETTYDGTKRITTKGGRLSAGERY